MTITAIAFTNSGVAIATDADLREYHPDINGNLWNGAENYRAILEASFNQALFDVTRNADFGTASLISNSTANIAWFKRVTVYQALVRIFRDFRAQSGDRWDMLVSDFQTQYDACVQNPVLDYDEDESGTVDTEEVGLTSQPEMVR